MRKIIAVAAIVLGIIAIAGSLYAMSIIVQFTSLMSAAPGGAAMLAGLDAISGLLMFGWLWTICVIGASAYAIYSGYKRLRE